MKKMMFTLIAMLTIAVSASAMSYEQARNEALFLTDKMAYELNLTDAQYEAAYEINLDYLMGVTNQYDVFGPYWERRNLDLSYILFSWQWELYRAATYFYRPLFFEAGYWHFGIYARYPHRNYFYFGRPAFYVSYRGGHSWRMNGGHSYYEGRRDFYRPDNRPRDQHFGMRNGWDRGDYRGVNEGRHSSTHVTGGNGNNGRPQGNGGSRQGGLGSSRNGGNAQPGRPANGNLQPQGTPSGRPNSSTTFEGMRPRQSSGDVRTAPATPAQPGSTFRGSGRTTVTPSQPSSAVGSSRVTPAVPSRSNSSVGSSRTVPSSSSQSGSTLGGSRTSGSHTVAPSASRSSSSGSSSSATRSAGSSGSSRSSSGNSHGSFGGSRR